MIAIVVAACVVPVAVRCVTMLRVIRGKSMVPALRPRETILALRVAPWGGLHVGQVLLVRRGGRDIVKRLAAVLPDGGLWLEGDNKAGSVDSRRFGPVSRRAVRGRVIAVLGPRGHARWVTPREPEPGANLRRPENGSWVM